MQSTWGFCPILAMVLAAIVGCGEPPLHVGDVSGVVSIKGKPLAKVSVLFTPDRRQGSSGPPSGAITDDSGRYTLRYSIPNDRDLSAPRTGTGGLVGWHTVVVDDFKMKDELLRPPGRVPARYTEPSTTPLRYEIKEGSQTIDISLDE